MNQFVITNLAKSPEYYKDVIQLIEKSFGYDDKHHFDLDFWTLIGPNNHKNCHFILNKKEDSVVCHIGVKNRDIRIKRNKHPVCLIGGIATDEKYRGQGKFKELFNFVLDKYKESSTFFLLWSEKSSLFQKFDFFEFGSVLQTGDSSLTEEKALSLGYTRTSHRKLSEVDKIKIKELHDANYKNFITLNRTSRDWYDISQTKSADLYIKKTDNKITDYFFINKGFDLQDIIYECSFFSDEKMIEELSPFKLWLPEKHKSYIEHKSAIYIGHLKVANTDLFKNFIHEIYSNDLYITKYQNKEIEFEFKDTRTKASERDFLSLTLGPEPAEEFKRYAPWIYISGIDSI